jgi:3-oxoacyl-[acyl-carrier-protein] synthase-3
MRRSVIIGTGSCIPEMRITNEAFYEAEFFEKEGVRLNRSNKDIIDRFQAITGISERRYAKRNQQASDLAYVSAENAVASARIDRETLDQIIVAHNFGDVTHETNRVRMVPSLASKVKALLGIKNPDCIAYDIAFGCPGWLEAVIQANYFIRSGDARRCLVIGAETLSRVIDVHDRDAMIFSDGSGAIVIEGVDDTQKGILSHKTRTYADQHLGLLDMQASFSPSDVNRADLFLKMNGRKVYEFALQYVPLLIKETLDKAGLHLRDINKVLIHQANDKMDAAILERLFKLYETEHIPEHILPMTISWLGNSSVATIPTLLDLIMKGEMKNHSLREGQIIVMASVGAGMNINALTYKF